MLDQPTQVFYESKSGGPKEYVGVDENTSDDDHDAVAQMFRLMYDIVEKHAPGWQIIVSDLANIDEPWFAESVRYNWRNGEGLSPRRWFTA